MDENLISYINFYIQNIMSCKIRKHTNKNKQINETINITEGIKFSDNELKNAELLVKDVYNKQIYDHFNKLKEKFNDWVNGAVIDVKCHLKRNNNVIDVCDVPNSRKNIAAEENNTDTINQIKKLSTGLISKIRGTIAEEVFNKFIRTHNEYKTNIIRNTKVREAPDFYWDNIIPKQRINIDIKSSNNLKYAGSLKAGETIISELRKLYSIDNNSKFAKTKYKLDLSKLPECKYLSQILFFIDITNDGHIKCTGFLPLLFLLPDTIPQSNYTSFNLE